MGIKNLLRNIKSKMIKRHISYYEKKKVGVDGYSWLHKSIHKDPTTILKNRDISPIVEYFKLRIDLLL